MSIFNHEKIFSKPWALYPSSGNDSKALTYTHPELLKQKISSDAPSVQIYIYVDRLTGKDLEVEFNFSDLRTQIKTQFVEKGEIFSYPAWKLHVEHKSDINPTRELLIYRIQAENDDFIQELIEHQCCHPDLFIGVCDGCRMGRNKRCLNNLKLPMENKCLSPKWWLTDHFENAYIEESERRKRISLSDVDAGEPFDVFDLKLKKGESIISKQPQYPFKFKNCGLLTGPRNWIPGHRSWGRYAGPVFMGPTLFKVLQQIL